MAAERRRKVSRSEYMSELGVLSGKTRRRRRLLSEWRSLRGRLGYLARVKKELAPIWFGWPPPPDRPALLRRYGLTSYAQIDEESKRLRTQMYHIYHTELPILDEEIDRERREIAEKIPPPPVREERVADEECTGYDIYFDLDDKIYNIRDPETRKLIRREDKICMELTASIETGTGHDVPVIVEITCTCYIKEKGLTDLIAAEKKVEASLREWLIEQGWANLIQAFMKEGVAYNSEGHVKEVGRYTWFIPDFPDVYVLVEKKQPRERTYSGTFRVE